MPFAVTRRQSGAGSPRTQAVAARFRGVPPRRARLASSGAGECRRDGVTEGDAARCFREDRPTRHRQRPDLPRSSRDRSTNGDVGRIRESLRSIRATVTWFESGRGGREAEPPLADPGRCLASGTHSPRAECAPELEELCKRIARRNRARLEVAHSVATVELVAARRALVIAALLRTCEIL